MEHAHTTASSHDHILAAFLEPGTLPDIAKRVNMSLAALATWASEHADLLANVHKLITTRCKLIAAHLELAALTALAAVSSSPPPPPPPPIPNSASAPSNANAKPPARSFATAPASNEPSA